MPSWKAKGEPLKAQKLREKPLKSPNSWSWPVVRQLVTSPVMTGYLPHKGEIYRHSQSGEMVRVGPKVISLADWTRLRAMFGERVPTHWKRAAVPSTKSRDTGRRVTGLLSDYLHCGECGSRESYDAYYVRNGKPWPRYRCIRRHFSGRCPGTLMKGPHADHFVTQAMVTRLNALDDDHPALLAIAERWNDLRHPEHAARRHDLEARIQEEEQFLDRLEEEKLSGLFPGARGEARFRGRYDAANERLTAYEKELQSLPTGTARDITFLRDSTLFEEAWEDWDLSTKRDILGLVLERSWLFKAPTSGVKPSIDRFRFWWVGDPEPTGIGVSLTLSDETV